MARHEDGSTDTLESNFEQVFQPAAPQVIQLSAKLVDNRADYKSQDPSVFPSHHWISVVLHGPRFHPAAFFDPGE